MRGKIPKALIIDDNVYKANDIRKALEACGIGRVSSVDNQEEAFDAIYESLNTDNPINLIVTDMHYPVKKGKVADTKAGFIFIERMKSEQLDIPIIICSSLNYEAPDAAGVVWYNKIRDLREDFMEIIKEIK